MMKFTPSNINRFLLFKLPSAWICGVRLRGIGDTQSTVTVRHRWINQNPFGSIYFAVQTMAAELSTGALVMKTIREHGHASMLVVGCQAEFVKKAVGKVTFKCDGGQLIKDAIQETMNTGEPVCVSLRSIGLNETGEKVSEMTFVWSIKAVNKR